VDEGRGAEILRATHAEVTEELGTVREVLVRALRGLRKQGLVAGEGRGRYRIPDPAALRDWCRREA
jgi:CRP-like cAMP-binding protein